MDPVESTDIVNSTTSSPKQSLTTPEEKAPPVIPEDAKQESAIEQEEKVSIEQHEDSNQQDDTEEQLKDTIEPVALIEQDDSKHDSPALELKPSVEESEIEDPTIKEVVEDVPAEAPSSKKEEPIAEDAENANAGSNEPLDEVEKTEPQEVTVSPSQNPSEQEPAQEQEEKLKRPEEEEEVVPMELASPNDDTGLPAVSESATPAKIDVDMEDVSTRPEEEQPERIQSIGKCFVNTIHIDF